MNTFDFNQVNNYWNNNDKEYITGRVNEMVNLYGLPCIHFSRMDTIYNVTDPLYDDIKSKHAMNEEFFEAKETRFYTDQKVFMNALSGIGEVTEENSNILVTMKFEDQPKIGDYIQLILPFSGTKYTFLINNSTNYYDICFSCHLIVAEFDFNISNDDEKLTQYEEVVNKRILEEPEAISQKKKGRPRKKKVDG